MYSKTNVGAGQLSPRGKHVLAAVGIAVVLVLAGLGIWAALAPDTDTSSAAGCVNVTVASSTGGATLHYCGSAARSFCRAEFAAPATDQLAVHARPQCRLAGLAPKP
jgi:hypothetical protein